MKAFFWMFVISFFVNQEMILAKLYDFPNLLESNIYNGEKSTRLSYRAKLVHLAGDCVQELGLRGESAEVRRSKLVCIIECIGRKINIIDDFDNFNEHGYRNFVYDLPLNDDQRSAVEHVLGKCMNNIKMLPNKFDEATGCNRIPTDAIVCVENAFHTLQ